MADFTVGRSLRRWVFAAVTAAALAASGTGAAVASTGSSIAGVHPSSKSGAGSGSGSAAASRAKPSVAGPKAQPPAYWLPDQPNLAGTFVPHGPTRLPDTRKGTGTNGVIAPVGQVPLLLDVSRSPGNPSIAPPAVAL